MRADAETPISVGAKAPAFRGRQVVALQGQAFSTELPASQIGHAISIRRIVDLESLKKRSIVSRRDSVRALLLSPHQAKSGGTARHEARPVIVARVRHRTRGALRRAVRRLFDGGPRFRSEFKFTRQPSSWQEVIVPPGGAPPPPESVGPAKSAVAGAGSYLQAGATGSLPLSR